MIGRRCETEEAIRRAGVSDNCRKPLYPSLPLPVFSSEKPPPSPVPTPGTPTKGSTRSVMARCGDGAGRRAVSTAAPLAASGPRAGRTRRSWPASRSAQATCFHGSVRRSLGLAPRLRHDHDPARREDPEGEHRRGDPSTVVVGFPAGWWASGARPVESRRAASASRGRRGCTGQPRRSRAVPRVRQCRWR
jgi:hypothetical protein